jgi:hypothetical protein
MRVIDRGRDGHNVKVCILQRCRIARIVEGGLRQVRSLYLARAVVSGLELGNPRFVDIEADDWNARSGKSNCDGKSYIPKANDRNSTSVRHDYFPLEIDYGCQSDKNYHPETALGLPAITMRT